MLIPMGVAGVVGTFCVIVGQRLDEQPDRLPRSSTARSPTSTRGGRCSTTVSGCSSPHMWVARVHGGRLRRRRACTPPACCAAGATRTTGSGSRCRSCSRRVAAIAQPLIGHVLGSGSHDTPAGEAGGVRARRRRPRALRRCGSGGVLIDGEVRWRVGDPATRLAHRPQLVRQAGARAGHDPRRRTGRRSTSPTWPSSRWWASARCWRWPWCCSGCSAGAVTTCCDNRWFLRFCGRRRAAGDPRGGSRLDRHRGRPPAVDGLAVLRTTDAASTSPGLWWSYSGVLVVYARHDGRGVRRAALHGAALARGRDGPAEPVRAARRRRETGAR